MELDQEILMELLKNQPVQIVFPNVTVSPNELVERKCYQALKEIKAVLEDDSLDDPDCFFKIEKIIEILEQAGSSAGVRHDFG